ncbi:MAG: DUF3237 domain-containing protein [Desulfopila sp.]
MPENDLHPRLEEIFIVEAQVAPPVVVGQDDRHGRRQLIEITGGIVRGQLRGKILPGGVDSQVIRPDGFTELIARYAIALDDGETIYIDNAGIRRVDPLYADEVAMGKIVDPQYVYFVTTPRFETYSDKYKWMERTVFICYALRLPDKVILKFYEVK